MKGIVLAGGSGTRLYPATKSISKQLLPVYDKPTIYYPLSVLMLAEIKEILIISTPRDLPMIKDLLGDGTQLGLRFDYVEQASPDGIAQAFKLGEKFLNGAPSCLVLGDNIFYGHDLQNVLIEAAQQKSGATILAYHVHDPERYGVVEFDKNNNAISIEEKPKNPKSNWVATGLYFYDDKVCEYVKTLKPSARGELEITDLNKIYLERGELRVKCLGRGMAWLDVGTHESLLSSSLFVQTIEQRQGLKIACLEEIALAKKFITTEQFIKLAEQAPNSSYGVYLKTIVKSSFR